MSKKWYNGWEITRLPDAADKVVRVRVSLPNSKGDKTKWLFEYEPDDFGTDWLLSHFELALATLDGVFTDEN